MRRLMALFQKVGGVGLLKQYARAHVLGLVSIQALILGVSRKALEIIRLCVENRIFRRLRKKTAGFVADFVEKNPPAPPAREKNQGPIWVCWFQGLDAAPEVVRLCVASLEKNLPDREIRLITAENYGEYVRFPAFIEEKHRAGIIGQAHFADLLRLELLIRYGGTWIDSTVLCTSPEVPSYLLDSELFVYQILKPGLDGHATCMSNWFISAGPENPILRLTLALLYDYWRGHDKLVDYFIFHHFFQIAAEAYPELWRRVVPCSSETPHMLLLRLFEPFNQQVYDGILAQTCFHKLTYKFSPEDAAAEDTYYARLLRDFGGK